MAAELTSRTRKMANKLCARRARKKSKRKLILCPRKIRKA